MQKLRKTKPNILKKKKALLKTLKKTGSFMVFKINKIQNPKFQIPNKSKIQISKLRNTLFSLSPLLTPPRRWLRGRFTLLNPIKSVRSYLTGLRGGGMNHPTSPHPLLSKEREKRLRGILRFTPLTKGVRGIFKKINKITNLKFQIPNKFQILNKKIKNCLNVWILNFKHYLEFACPLRFAKPETVLEIIIKNFEQIFGWVSFVGK